MPKLARKVDEICRCCYLWKVLFFNVFHIVCLQKTYAIGCTARKTIFIVLNVLGAVTFISYGRYSMGRGVRDSTSRVGRI